MNKLVYALIARRCIEYIHSVLLHRKKERNNMGAFDEKAPIILPDPDNADEAAKFRKKWGWEAHEQVLLKPTVTVADQIYVSNQTVRSKKNGEMEMFAGVGRYAILERMIINWTFMKNGQRVPVSASSIQQLPANYSNPILEKLDAMAAAMTEDEQQDFLTSSNGHTQESFESSLVRLPQ